VQRPIHLLLKSKPKVSILAIIRKLKLETTIRLWKTQKEYLKKYYWKEHTLWTDDIFHLLSAMLAKKQPEITYGTRGEVDTYIY
jgi:putative transposase